MAEGGVRDNLEEDELSDGSEDWDEIETAEPIQCIFCEENVQDFPHALQHLEHTHAFNLKQYITRRRMDTYSYIKFINYIREKKLSVDQVKALTTKKWEQDRYFCPVIPNDPWLMFDIEDEIEVTPVPFVVNSEGGNVTLSEVHFAELQRTIQSLKAKLEQKEESCRLAQQQIDAMKEEVRKLILDEDQPLDNAQVEPARQNTRFDDGYFNTYNHFAIHHEMLTDKVRTESYRDALLMNSIRFKDRIILDVGCGTGILSMFAAKTGCHKVLSVDQSDVIYHAMDIVRENELNDVITLKKGRLEDIEFYEEKVDAIVSEWMGYFLLFEGMLDTVIYARDHYLFPGGVLLPNRCTLSIVGSGDTKRYVDLVDYWSNVYGFKMSCMKAEVLREPSIEICNPEHLVTNAAEIQSFDLYTVTKDCVNFSASFQLTVQKTGSLTAIVGYFDVFFDLEKSISFSTGPQAPPTHWKQTVFSLSEPMSITEGEVLKGKLICRRHVNDVRGLIVTIQIQNFRQTYYLD